MLEPGSVSIASPTLVGRRPELATLLVAVARAERGQFSFVLIEGDAGIGKTRLVRELEASPECSGFHVLSGACVDFGGEDLPYAPIVAALRTAPQGQLADVARALPPAMATELGRLMPGLPHEEVARDGSRGAQGRLYEYLLEMLRRLGESAPVLLVLEDLHWADQSTRDFVAFAARNARRDRIALIATYRLHDLPDSHPVEAYLAGLKRCDTVEAIELRALTRSEVRAQMTGILGREPSPDVLDRVTRRTQGIPFFVEELLAAGPDGAAQLPRGQRTALLFRVRALPPRTQELVRLLAAFARPAPQTLLGAAAGVAEPELSQALRIAVEEHIIERHGEQDLAFRHALAREAVYQDLLSGEKQALHRAVASILYDHPNLTDVAELAVQWRAAGDTAAALAASLAAARAANDVYAYGEAVEHFRAAIALWTPAAAAGLQCDRAAMLLDAAEAAQLAGTEGLPIEWCLKGLEALGLDPDRARAAGFYERLGRYQDHHLDKSLEYYGSALACLPPTPSAARARLLADEALTLMLGVRWEEARERAAEALEIALAAGATAEEGFARSVLGLLLAYHGEFAAGEAHLLRALALGEEQGGAPDDVTRVYVHLGEARRLRGDLRGAARVMEAGREMSRRLGVEASYGRYLSLNAAEDEFELGEWESAERRVRALEGVALTWSEMLLLNTVSGQLATVRGDLDGAREWLRRAREQLRPSSATEWVAYVAAAAADLGIAAGEPEPALRAAEADLDWLSGNEDRLYTPALLAAAARAAAQAAQGIRALRGDAAAFTAAAERALARLDALLEAPSPPTAHAHRATAAAEWQRTCGVADPAAWSRAVDAWEALEHPYRAACARFHLAEALVDGPRDRVAARDALAPAFDTVTRLGAVALREDVLALARRARLDLGAQAERPLAPVAADALGLTVRELDVLVLLAEGRTNKEIAQRLVIEAGTARVHVSSILRKLGAANRTEAAGKARHVLAASRQRPST